MKKYSGTRIALILIVLSFLCFLVAGCVKLTKPYPIKQYFVLEAKRSGAPGLASKTSIRIKDPEISPLFSTKSFVYKVSDLEFSTDFYNEFFIVPDRMIKTQAVEWLRQSGVFRRINSDPGEKSDYVLETNIVNLYIDKSSSPNKAVFETSFFLVSGATGGDEVLWHGNHVEEEPVATDSSKAMAEAWSRSLEKTLQYLEKNLAASVKR